MKRLLVLILCAIMLTGVASCAAGTQEPQATTKEENADIVCPFVSDEVRQTWERDIFEIFMSRNLYEEREYGCLGTALMDLNFDCTPELIVAYTGGSMGNVFTVIYDLRTKEELYYYDAPNSSGDLHLDLCVYAGQNGEYLTLGEGMLRPDGFWYHMIYELSPQIKMKHLFDAPMDEGFYYCNNQKVKRADFEMRKEHFDAYYTRIVQTQLQLIYWKDITARDKQEAVRAMTDALLGSTQEFVDFLQTAK